MRSVSPDALKNLWITTGLQFGRLTGGVDLDYGKPGVEGLRVYVTPLDENGVGIQAAGSFVVEAFDLALPGDNRLGRWTWDTPTAKSLWRNFLLEFGYELTCVWQKVPSHPDIHIRVTFTDELTHISYVADKTVHVELPVSADDASRFCPSAMMSCTHVILPSDRPYDLRVQVALHACYVNSISAKGVIERCPATSR